MKAKDRFVLEDAIVNLIAEDILRDRTSPDGDVPIPKRLFNAAQDRVMEFLNELEKEAASER